MTQVNMALVVLNMQTLARTANDGSKCVFKWFHIEFLSGHSLERYSSILVFIISSYYSMNQCI